MTVCWCCNGEIRIDGCGCTKNGLRDKVKAERKENGLLNKRITQLEKENHRLNMLVGYT